jgi:hypothetical protein
MPFHFVFMLTRNDETVADAAEHVPVALAAGVRHIGFKDKGLPISALIDLDAALKAGGATTYLEVVSLDRASEIASAEAAVEIGVDVLMGGTRADDVLPVIAGTGIDYRPFPGRIVGHPSVLEGTIASITDSARELSSRAGVGGRDLLAYRYAGDVPKLMASVCGAVETPVIAAGSIDGIERIRAVAAAGCAGFTIGTAAIEGVFAPGAPGLASQLTAILDATRAAAQGVQR